MTAQDAEIREALLAHGDSGDEPRNTIFYFYEGDIGALELEARAHEFSTRRMVEHRGLILEKTIPVSERDFEPISQLMDLWAVRFGAEYDGWECELLARQ